MIMIIFVTSKNYCRATCIEFNMHFYVLIFRYFVTIFVDPHHAQVKVNLVCFILSALDQLLTLIFI